MTYERWKIAQRFERAYWQLYKVAKSKRRRLDVSRYSQYASILKKYVKMNSETKALDIGCGPDGMITFISGDRYGMDPLINYYSSDFSMPKDIRWMMGVGEAIPLKDECFDILISTNTMDHVYHPRLMLKEMNRVLKKGGILFLTVRCHGSLTKFVRKTKELMLGRTGKVDPYHPHTFSSKDIIRKLENSGFVIKVNHLRNQRTDSTEKKAKKILSYLCQCRTDLSTPFHSIARWFDARTFYYRVEMIFIAVKSNSCERVTVGI